MAELGTTAPGAPAGWVRSITRYQWLVFFVVWAGWSLDAADFGLYSLVLAPALRGLLGGLAWPARPGRYRPRRRHHQHGWTARLGDWRVHLRHHRRLYRPGPHPGAEHPDL